MVEAFEDFIKQNKLFSKRQSVILAVSGGIDSVVMCRLFKQSGYKFAIAHCNFSLRGEESDADAEFVKQLAEELKCPYYEKKIDTIWQAKHRKQSIQVVARELRYEWFEKLCDEEGYDRIATAHHINDSVETIFYNMSKGCGIRGLHGILPKRERIVRPLLFADKKDILEYAKSNGIEYREDSSNGLDKYSRNKIRNNVLPLLREINPVLDKTLAENIQRFQAAEAIYDWSIQYWKSQLLKSAMGGFQLDATAFEQLPAPKTILYEILKPFEFNADQVEQMLEVKESGKLFYSPTYKLLVDRTHWYIKKLEHPEHIEWIVDELSEWVDLPDGNRLHFRILETREEVVFGNPNEGFFDERALQFPLTFRKWQKGDIFQPLGMGGNTKKISDYFIERKMSSFAKENTWLMESKGNIAWMVGYRADHRFQLTTDTKKIVVIKWYAPMNNEE
jgi:tRNA(Ile)-lysidine synthase